MKSNNKNKLDNSIDDQVLIDKSEFISGNSAEESLAKSLRKGLIFLLVFIVLIIVIYFSPLRHYVKEIPEFAKKINEYGIWGPVIYMGCVFIYIVCGGPRLLIYPVGGMAFGFFWGLLWTEIGVVLSYYIVFLFVRWGGRSIVLHWFPKLESMGTLIKKGGIPAVIMVRQLPLYGIIINLLLALSPIKHIPFLVGSFIGTLPAGIPCTLLGSSTASKSIGNTIWYMIIAVIIFSLLWLFLKFHLSRVKRKKLIDARRSKRK